MKKRLLSIILSMTMCVSILPMTAFADVTEYNLWVNGERFTSEKLTIECGDGTAKFDPDKSLLTLTDATITDACLNGAIHSKQGIDIVTKGTNVINLDESTGYYGIYVYGDLTLSGEGSLDVTVANGVYDGIWTENGDLTVDMAGKLTIDAGDDGLYASYDLKVTGSGDIDIKAGDDGLYSWDKNIILSGSGNIDIKAGEEGMYCYSYSGNKDKIILSGSGDITISDSMCAMLAPKVEINGSADINIKDTWLGVSTESVTLSGSGDFIATVSVPGICTTDLVLSGTGKVDITSQDDSAVYLYDPEAAVLLNGKNPEVSFKTSDGIPAVYNKAIDGVGTVAGDNFSKYDVEGAPEESSVKYTLKTYNVTFDMGGHGTAPEDQKVYLDEVIEKPEDPTADGYKFEGWYSDRACTKAFDFEVAYNVDTTIFAKWTCLHKNTEVRDAKDATLTSEGYTGDTYCKDCGELIKKGEEIPTLTPEPSGTRPRQYLQRHLHRHLNLM